MGINLRRQPIDETVLWNENHISAVAHGGVTCRIGNGAIRIKIGTRHPDRAVSSNIGGRPVHVCSCRVIEIIVVESYG